MPGSVAGSVVFSDPGLTDCEPQASPIRGLETRDSPLPLEKGTVTQFESALSGLANLHRDEVRLLQEDNRILRRYISKLEGIMLTEGAGIHGEGVMEVKHAFGIDSGAGHPDEAAWHCTDSWPLWKVTAGVVEQPKVLEQVKDGRLKSRKTRKTNKKSHAAGQHAHFQDDVDGTRAPSAFHNLVATKTAQELADGTLNAVATLKQPREFFSRVFTREHFDSVKRNASSLRRMNHRSVVSTMLQHTAFNIVCSGVIILNSALVGASVEWQARNSMQENNIIAIILDCCSFFFLVELSLRIFADGFYRFYCLDPWRGWNVFDTVLVAFSLLEKFFQIVWVQNGETEIDDFSTMGAIVKGCKMLRVVRLFRVFRFFRELSDLALMVVDAGRSLIWAIMMLAIIVFVFACYFTSSASGYAAQASAPDPTLNEYFGNLDKTTYTLIQTTLGGVSWGEVSDQLLKMDVFTVILFFFYLFFTVLAVLNIITGVFVENAVELARNQRDFMAQKERELKEKYVAELQELFSEIDEDCSGTVSIDEIWCYFEDPGVQSYFQALGLEVGDAERLFTLIDDDGSGDVSLVEFIDGCLRLKGLARSIDMFNLILMCQRMEAKITDLVSAFNQEHCIIQASPSKKIRPLRA